MPGMKRGLGRGLEALLPGMQARENERAQEIDVAKVRPNPHQPRMQFDEQSLGELAESIRQYGVLQPLIVRRAGDGFELVAGERRWRAAQLAGLQTVPAIIRQFDDHEMTEVALIENLQRENLNPIETARAYRMLMDVHGLDQDEIAARVSKSRSAVANSLRLLALEDEIQEHVERGELSEGHARALLAIPGGERRRAAARKVIEEALSVRKTEELARRLAARPAPAARHGAGPVATTRTHPDVARLERELTESLAAPVRIRSGGRKGTIEVDFFGDEDLERIVGRLLSSGTP